MQRLGLLLLCSLLAGCGGSGAKALTSNRDGVTVIFDGSRSEMKKTTAVAMEECQRYGGTAVLQGVSELDNDFVAAYNCVQ